MLDSNKWKIPEYFNDNRNDLDIESLKFMFSQCEKRLEETVKSADSITNKAYRILPITLTIMILCTGYVFSERESQILLFSAMFTLSWTTASLYLIIRAIWPYEIQVLGSQPSQIFDKDFVKGFKGIDQYKVLLLIQTSDIQNRIDHNDKKNDARRELVNKSIIWLSLIPLSIIFSSILSFFLGNDLISCF